MNDIYAITRQTIQQWLISVSATLRADAKVAVFGAGPYGRYILQLLRAKGIECPVFIDAVHAGNTLDNCPVIRLEELHIHQITDVISGSLAAPDAQLAALKSTYPILRFHAIANGKYLCTEPRFNPCEKAKLAQLKLRVMGKTVCVIGNGPSLNQTPPEQLKGCVHMAGNGILLRACYLPDYYFMLEQKALQHWGDKIKHLQVPQILPSHLFEYLGDAPQRFYYPACYESAGPVIDPFNYGIAAGGTIISTMIYFAVYMGAARIVLLGVDNNFVGAPTQTHFSQTYYAGDRPALEASRAISMAEKQKVGILKAVTTAVEAGVPVFDATAADNKLGIDRLSYDQLKVECSAER
ncbi:MAG: 6-hydroxymethylpterin diphosphokinase MptE-like protein [Alishewanella aestuarii]